MKLMQNKEKTFNRKRDKVQNYRDNKNKIQ